MKDLLDSSVINTPRVGNLAVTAQMADGSSRLKDLFQNGCLKALFPNQPDHLEAVLINTSGGIPAAIIYPSTQKPNRRRISR